MADGRRDYAVLSSPFMREEALVVAATLRAHGVDAVVGNWHHANADWEAAVALGGLQVLVPFPALDQARALLAGLRVASAAEPADEIAVRRDRWKFWLLAGVMVPNLALSLFYVAAQAVAIARHGFIYDYNYIHDDALSQRDVERLKEEFERRFGGE